MPSAGKSVHLSIRKVKSNDYTNGLVKGQKSASFTEHSAQPPPGFFFTAFLGRFPKFTEPKAFAFFGLLHILK